MPRPVGNDQLPTVATWLGRAGLLPFCAAPLAMYVMPLYTQLIGGWLASYALAIICFLTGAWWGLALIRRSVAALVTSNAAVLVAVFGYILLPGAPFLFLCAALFPFTILVERSMQLFKPQPSYYARLRLQLSAVASAALLLAGSLLRAGA